MRQGRMVFGALGFLMFALCAEGCSKSEDSRMETSAGPVTGPALWARRIGADGAQAGWLLDTTGTGDIVLVGTMEGEVEFGGAGAMQAATESDVFVAWMGQDGTISRASHFGKTGYHVPIGLAADGTGGVVISGLSEGKIDFGGGTLGEAGSTDAFLASIGPGGEYRFALHVGDAGMQNGGEVAIDNDGNILWAGSFEGTVDVGGISITSHGDSDLFVAKVDPTGKVLWAKGFGGSGYEGDGSLVIDGQGHVLVSGYYEGAPDFGAGALPDTDGMDGELILAVDGDGNALWSRGVVNGTGYFPFTMQVSEEGEVYLIGELSGSIDLFGKTIATDTLGIAVARLDAVGAPEQAQVFTAEMPGHVYAAPAKGGGIVIAGYFEGSIDLGKPLKSAGEDDLFVAWIDRDGKAKRQERLGGPGRERIGDVTVLPNGDVVIAGAFEGTLDIGGGAAQSSAGGPDVFVSRVR
jgi:hypothetical protein